jgi:hypothetical protein
VGLGRGWLRAWVVGGACGDRWREAEARAPQGVLPQVCRIKRLQPAGTEARARGERSGFRACDEAGGARPMGTRGSASLPNQAVVPVGTVPTGPAIPSPTPPRTEGGRDPGAPSPSASVALCALAKRALDRCRRQRGAGGDPRSTRARVQRCGPSDDGPRRRTELREDPGRDRGSRVRSRAREPDTRDFRPCPTASVADIRRRNLRPNPARFRAVDTRSRRLLEACTVRAPRTQRPQPAASLRNCVRRRSGGGRRGRPGAGRGCRR